MYLCSSVQPSQITTGPIPVFQPTFSAPVHIPTHVPPASSSHASSYMMYPPVLSNVASTAAATYGPHSQLPSAQEAHLPAYAMQPPRLPTPQTQSAYSQPSSYHPNTAALYQPQLLPSLPSQQHQPHFSVLQPPSVSYALQPSGPPPNPDFSLPVVPVQQIPNPRFPSRIEGPSFPYFTHSDPHEFVMLKMAFSNLLPADEPELYKYHILLDHLRLPSARYIALSYAHDRQPFTMALAAVEHQYGQPHQLALKEIQCILNLPRVGRGDAEGFQAFAVRVRSLVGMLQSLNSPEGAAKLACSSHVQRLLGKLPVDLVANYARHARSTSPYVHYNLVAFSAWLEGEAECQAVITQTNSLQLDVPPVQRREPAPRYRPPSTTILYGAERVLPHARTVPGYQRQHQTRYPCTYCNSTSHYLTHCNSLKDLSTDKVMEWLNDHRRCWRCGRNHRAIDCTLRKPCPKCNGQHLGIFHDVNKAQTASRVFYLNPQSMSPKVLLKVVKVRLINKNKIFDTYAILDDGSERTMLLRGAAEYLGLRGEPEKLELRTVRQQTETLNGRNVNLKLSAASCPEREFSMDSVFTSDNISFVEQSYPVDKLKQRYQHLQGLPLTPFSKVQPHILIGSDNPFLITPIERVHHGPKGAPAAVKTRLGWALQGPTSLGESSEPTQCLFTLQASPYTDLKQHVEKLWQVDTLPFRNEKLITRSKQDQEAINLLNAKTTRLHIDGAERYATPLLKTAPPELKAPYESVMPLLRRSERKSQWPACPAHAIDTATEQQKPLFCGLTQPAKPLNLPDSNGYATWTDLVNATCKSMQDLPCRQISDPQDLPRTKAEDALISQAQSESFPEGIFNSKPSGYASSDIADPDPITPNLLLTGRRDPSLPQAVYADTNGPQRLTF
ncbi:uncharacterized protein LOC117827042 isoform X1 [Notolabrus celidotus]|uniref:uncharacterized protein LOC117827042 isoform X1 n=1 Tax=Notolabrus celidotus TaxID=1203425 RepID=UPI00148FFECB|nr:uncharacterized protein LOC117827042 isoform X1 [Notolabrus celidotus]